MHVFYHYFLEKVEIPSGNPCVPTPCGPNSQCRVINTQAVCSCLPNYIGRAPNCRPECLINAECSGNLACQNERCIDPCRGSCGSFTVCTTIKHTPVCQCTEGYSGDPFRGCVFLPPSKTYFFLCIFLYFTINFTFPRKDIVFNCTAVLYLVCNNVQMFVWGKVLYILFLFYSIL